MKVDAVAPHQVVRDWGVTPVADVDFFLGFHSDRTSGWGTGPRVDGGPRWSVEDTKSTNNTCRHTKDTESGRARGSDMSFSSVLLGLCL